MTNASQWSYRDVLALTVMRRIWYAQIISLLGDVLALFAVIAAATFQMHATAPQVTGIQIAYLAPLAVLGPLSGVFVDRWPIKATLVGSDLVRAALVVLLIVSTTIVQIYAVLIALSVVSAFFLPAQSVAIRQHVPPEGLLSANALMHMALMTVRIVGPLAAAALVAALGAGVCYAIDAASFVASAALIGTVAIGRPPDPRAFASPVDSRLRALFQDMAVGMRFVAGHSTVLFMVSAMAAGLFIIGCFAPLIAIFVRESLHADEKLFGAASAMMGAGLLAGVQAIRSIASRAPNDVTIPAGLLGLGLALLLLGAVPLALVTLVSTFAIGFAFSGIMVPAQTLLQRETPPELMGRVSSTVMSAVILAQLLGLVISGAATQVLSVRAIFFGSALLAGLLALAGRRALASRPPP